MKLNYYSDTDSLYIDLSEKPSVESREISEGIVLDYDAAGNLVGIDIDNASRKVELKKLILKQTSGSRPEQLSLRTCTEIDDVMVSLTVSSGFIFLARTNDQGGITCRASPILQLK